MLFYFSIRMKSWQWDYDPATDGPDGWWCSYPAPFSMWKIKREPGSGVVIAGDGV